MVGLGSRYKNIMKTINKVMILPLLAMSFMLMVGQANAATFTPISRYLGVGDSGADVRNLQLFLASNSLVYPQGLVTGYYGSLTKNAVIQFQISQDIFPVGVVGPMTLARINQIIASDKGLDISACLISSVTVDKNSNSAFIKWSTNELSKGKVYYSTTPIVIREASGNFMEPFITSSVLNVEDANFTVSKAISISGLQSNTIYYYMIVSTDSSGNVSITLPSSFMTTI